jgi:L-asparaginase
MNQREKVLLLSTGGTIEKTYDEEDGSLVNRATVVFQHLLNRLRLPYTSVDLEVVMAKDSLLMTDQDRGIILNSVQAPTLKGLPVVILHGTDTMEVTARYLFDRLKDIKAPIVFTGAMRPLEFENSDALQNVTEALMAAKLAKPGIYISFHNRLFEVPKVRKNKKAGTFEEC